MMLRGKTALITGGTSGIGFVTARLFLANGARVAITGSNPAKLSEARSALGGDIITICADVQSRGDLARMREELEAAFGSLNICFANAGVAFQTPIESTDEVMFNKLMDVNVKGVFFSVQAVLPIMPPGSSIILSTSWLN